jgi:transcriptional regulator with XRE-family HTH domain
MTAMRVKELRQPPRGATMSQEEVAELFGVTKSYVGQVERRVLRKLARNPLVRRLAKECGIKVE